MLYVESNGKISILFPGIHPFRDMCRMDQGGETPAEEGEVLRDVEVRHQGGLPYPQF